MREMLCVLRCHDEGSRKNKLGDPMHLSQALSHTYTRDLIPLKFYKEDVTFFKQFVERGSTKIFSKIIRKTVCWAEFKCYISSLSFLMDEENYQAQENLLMFRIHKKRCRGSI